MMVETSFGSVVSVILNTKTRRKFLATLTVSTTNMVSTVKSVARVVQHFGPCMCTNIDIILAHKAKLMAWSSLCIEAQCLTVLP